MWMLLPLQVSSRRDSRHYNFARFVPKLIVSSQLHSLAGFVTEFRLAIMPGFAHKLMTSVVGLISKGPEVWRVAVM